MNDLDLTHAEAVEQGLVALYHRGRLEPELEARFEVHFFACPLCQEELEHQRRFEQALRALAAEETGRREAAPATARVLRFPFTRPTALLALAAGLLLAAGLGFSWLWWSRGELAQSAERLAREVEAERREKVALSSRLDERQTQWNDERRQLEEKLAAERAPRADQAQPLAGTPVLLLARMRGSVASTLNVLELGKAPALVHLAVDAGADPRFVSYRVRLSKAEGEEIWSAKGLQPNALEVLLLTFPRDFFQTGTYRLEVSGALASGATEALDAYRFHVTR